MQVMFLTPKLMKKKAFLIDCKPVDVFEYISIIQKNEYKNDWLVDADNNVVCFGNRITVDSYDISANPDDYMELIENVKSNSIGTDEGAKHDNRYDVTILVNGFPLVHIELKRRGVPIREAFNQIDRYQRDSFWAGCGLYEYVQLFVISNGTSTKYYSNSTRFNAIKDAGAAKTKKGKTSICRGSNPQRR